jgi:hypothetical protein
VFDAAFVLRGVSLLSPAERHIYSTIPFRVGFGNRRRKPGARKLQGSNISQHFPRFLPGSSTR